MVQGGVTSHGEAGDLADTSRLPLLLLLLFLQLRVRVSLHAGAMGMLEAEATQARTALTQLRQVRDDLSATRDQLAGSEAGRRAAEDAAAGLRQQLTAAMARGDALRGQVDRLEALLDEVKGGGMVSKKGGKKGGGGEG